MKIKILFLFVLISSLLLSCSQKNHYTAAASASQRMPEFKKLDKIYQKYLNEHGAKFTIDIKVNRNYLFTTNYKLLKDSSFDMAVMTNANFETNDSIVNGNSTIRCVMPINSRILYIAYNKNKISPIAIQDLFEGRKVLILSNETDFIHKILADLGVNLDKAEFLKNRMNSGDSTGGNSNSDTSSRIRYYNLYKENKPLPYDVEVGFASDDFTSSTRLNKFLNARHEFVLFSLDNYQLFDNGSIAEGFCLRNKFFTPYLLPKGAFGQFPESPIISIRQDFILAAQDYVSDEFIFEFVKTALEETNLINLTNYGQNFENMSLVYPLHEGTKRYLDKNAPTFYEKSSDLLAKIGTGAAGLYTVLMSLIIWRKRRRRKTIFNDYQTVLDIQSNISKINENSDLESYYIQLQTIENKYHLMVLERKILVDESLQIFLDLIDKNEAIILREIKRRNYSQ